MENKVRLIDAIALMKVIGDHDYPLVDKYNSVGFGMYTIGIQQAVDEAPTIDPESLRPKGRWILEAHNERVNCRWNVTAECSECCDEKKEIWAGFFPGVPDSMAREVSLMDAKQVKLTNYCPNCGAKMEEQT